MATPIARLIPGVSFQLSCSKMARRSARSRRSGALEDIRPATPLLGTTSKDKAAELLAHGLLRASFVPDMQTQEMRNLLRTRKQLPIDG